MMKLGIIGGLGPEATIYMYKLILKYTPAEKDQDHIPTIIYSNNLIPDRPYNIINGNHELMIKALSDTAKVLENAGASILIMACNTAHYYHEYIQKNIQSELIDMVQVTADYLSKKMEKLQNKRVGLLGHKILLNKVYQERFTKHNITLYQPNNDDQEMITEIIYKIKQFGPLEEYKIELNKVIQRLRNEYTLSWVIIGCTELPLLYGEIDLEKMNLIEPMDILAKYIVKKIKGNIKKNY